VSGWWVPNVMLVALTPGTLLLLELEPHPATASATISAQAAPTARGLMLNAFIAFSS
jgi:hypothetical protein